MVDCGSRLMYGPTEKPLSFNFTDIFHEQRAQEYLTSPHLRALRHSQVASMRVGRQEQISKTRLHIEATTLVQERPELILRKEMNAALSTGASSLPESLD